jgi:hypothetical protein
MWYFIQRFKMNDCLTTSQLQNPIQAQFTLLLLAVVFVLMIGEPVFSIPLSANPNGEK